VAPTCTVLNIPVTDIATTMSDLKSKGVVFEVYNDNNSPMGIKTDATGLFQDKDHHMAIAWFKDPAGNFVSLIEG